VFIVLSIYFVIDSVWKLLNTPSYEDDIKVDLRERGEGVN